MPGGARCLSGRRLDPAAPPRCLVLLSLLASFLVPGCLFALSVVPSAEDPPATAAPGASAEATPPLTADPGPEELEALPSRKPLPPPESLEPLAVTEEMRRFVGERVSRSLSPADRLSALRDAVFGRGGLDVEYGSSETYTAAATFRQRAGNCISFTNLLVALAREAGLAAYFAEVDEVLARDLRREALVANKHMVVEVEAENALIHVDVSSGVRAHYRSVRRISDRRAEAHFFSNLGVELMLEGRPGAALPYLEHAVRLAPDFADPWNNLGVALRRTGDHRGAERAYLEARELDRSELAPLSNLAILYRLTGREAEAEELSDKVRRYRRRNPYRSYHQGREAQKRGELEHAVRHYRSAVRRGPEEARFHFALGDVLYRLGQLDQAVQSLRRAVRLADEDSERRHFTRALQAVETLRGAAGGE